MRFLRAVAMVALAALGSCGDDEKLGTTEAPIIDPSVPFVGPAVVSLPSLGAHGRVVETPYYDTSTSGAHGVQFTDGVDLMFAPVEDRSNTDGIFDARRDQLAAVANANYAQPPAFPTRVREALDRANARMSSLSAGVLLDAAQVFKAFPEFSDPTPTDPVRDFAAWQPPRARWLDSQWAFPILAGPTPSPETHFHYPTPSALGFMPERGARLYCAAEQMALHQPTSSYYLGRRVLVPISILGVDIDIGVFKPFAYVDNPEKFVAPPDALPETPPPADGVQAFNIPFQLGVQISPVEPFLPPLQELRYPLVLTTADGQVATNTDPGLVYEDKHCFTTWLCLPIIRPEFRKRYTTVAHADSALTIGQGMSTHAQLPLFWAGPLFVQLNIGFGASVGTTAPPVLGEIPSVTVAPVSNDRLLAMQIPPADWPAEIRSGTAAGIYEDGYWRIPQSYFNPDSGLQFYDIHRFDETDSIVGTLTTAPQDGMRTSILEDDDHHVTPTSELAIAGGLEGDLGYDAEFATLEVKASGNFKVTAGLAHDVREGMSVFAGFFGSSLEPIDNLTITPVSYVDAVMTFIVKFKLHIELVFGHLDVDYDIINKTIPIASKLSRWGEDNSLRLGTASPTVALKTDDQYGQPSVDSHFGPEPGFPSFPPGHSVAQCLADPPVSVPVPPPCPSHPASGEPPHVEACITMDVSPQIDPCLNIPSPTNGGDLAQDCLSAKLTYFCKPVSKEQAFEGAFLLAHKLELATAPDQTKHIASDELTRMSVMTRACALAASPTGPLPDPDAWFKDQFKIKACDASATLLDSDALITTRPDGDGGVTAGGSCL